MKRLGALLVFKEGIDPATAKSAIKWMEALLDPDYFIGKTERARYNPRERPELVLAEDGDKVLASVESFEDKHGGPVWYLP